MPVNGREASVKSSVCRVEDSPGGRYLEARVQEMGEDLVVAVGGGQRPHVGSVVLAQPVPSKRPGKAWTASCSLLTIPPHKEEPIARGIATEDGELPDDTALHRILDAAVGLTRYEAEGAFSLSLVRHGRVQPDTIWQLKSQTLKKSGLLQLHRGSESFDGLGGLDALKTF